MAKKLKKSAPKGANDGIGKVVKILQSIDARLAAAIQKAGLAPKPPKSNAEPRKKIRLSEVQKAKQEKRRRENRADGFGS